MTTRVAPREVVTAYREARARFNEAAEKADAAFDRWFAKVQAGEPTNAAQAQRLANEVSYRSADLAVAQSGLYRIGLDPWDIDDADGVDRTPL